MHYTYSLLFEHARPKFKMSNNEHLTNNSNFPHQHIVKVAG